MFFVESSESIPACPDCHGAMMYRASRTRVRKSEGGERDLLMIRRFHWCSCHRYHNELPDCIAPYKHYETEIISGVTDEVVTLSDTDSEDYPSLETMRRWLKWFILNLARIEGYPMSIGYSILRPGKELLFSQVSLLETIRHKYLHWLEKTLRLVFNSGDP